MEPADLSRGLLLGRFWSLGGWNCPDRRMTCREALVFALVGRLGLLIRGKNRDD